MTSRVRGPAKARSLAAVSENRRPTWARSLRRPPGLAVSEAKRLGAIEDENRRLKQVVADLSLDNCFLKDIASENF